MCKKMSEVILKNLHVIDPARNIDAKGDLAYCDGVMVEPSELKNPEIIDLNGLYAAPGFLDLHVHLRQPGNTTAETVETGTKAAAAGGLHPLWLCLIPIQLPILLVPLNYYAVLRLPKV
jgi:dihydroorotase